MGSCSPSLRHCPPSKKDSTINRLTLVLQCENRGRKVYCLNTMIYLMSISFNHTFEYDPTSLV